MEGMPLDGKHEGVSWKTNVTGKLIKRLASFPGEQSHEESHEEVPTYKLC